MRVRPVIRLAPDGGRYPKALPYEPPERFPELGFLAGDGTDPENDVYRGVRALLRGLGYDAGRFGTPAWSPLSDLVGPGGTVVLKPNYVRHYHERGGDFDAVVTHASVLRPLLDYAWKAVGPDGTVIVADAPQYDCDVEVLLERTGLPALLDWYGRSQGLPVAWRDLRVQFGRQDRGVVLERRQLPGDPEGYRAVDLGARSAFAALDRERGALLRGADYDHDVTLSHHRGGKHEYLVSRTVLAADLVINCPKVKTHKKSGVTLSMKNLIGINGDKNWLPHYRAGFPGEGGDEFPRSDAYARARRFGADLARRLLRRGVGGALFRRLRAAEDAAGLGERFRNGNWYGNDTIWRTCIDLNRIFYHCDGEGRFGAPRRRLHVYDGVVAGEGDGPMAPDPKPVGLLAAGEDGVAADVVVAWLMGFDWRRLPILREAVAASRGELPITAFSGDPAALPVLWLDPAGERERRLDEIDESLAFEPHPAWKGTHERESEE